MYAVFTSVTIAAGQFESAQKTLQQDVVPRAKQAPGFVKGFWSVNADRTQGTSLVLFDTQANAENASKMAGSMPPPTGVTIGHVVVREIVPEA